MVQSAFFTEPDDQSAWLYHRWLLSKVSPLINSTTNLHLKLQPNLNQNFGDVSRLKAELALTEELLANEPNCKWALLTVAVLVLALDKAGEDTKKSKDNISALFSHIISLDPMRKGYFQDVLKSLA
jgi:geranylgeranyl transferase type-2 subunit alpha